MYTSITILEMYLDLPHKYLQLHVCLQDSDPKVCVRGGGGGWGGGGGGGWGVGGGWSCGKACTSCFLFLLCFMLSKGEPLDPYAGLRSIFLWLGIAL